ncbi:MAG: hypothetical protein WC069_06210 [Candidatus Shapirobacteria bacterium]
MPKRITSDYESNTKEDLLLEAATRKKSGSPNFDSVDLKSKGAIIAALILDDEHAASKPSEEAKFKSAGQSVEIPQVEVSPVADVSAPVAPGNEEFKLLATRLSDGQKYAVAFHSPDTYGKTVTAKNSANFWQGNEADFRLQFDK